MMKEYLALIMAGAMALMENTSASSGVLTYRDRRRDVKNKRGEGK